MKKQTDLSRYDNKNFSPGANVFMQVLWYFTNALFFSNRLFVFVRPKRMILRLFGAKIGYRVMLKPAINIKYPWLLEIGDYVWIGEGCWIDNLTYVKIGAHSVLSQDTMILTGNHDYTKVTFDLITKPVTVENGCWIGAKSIIAPGVNCGEHSVLAVLSAATKDMEPYSVYQGNPAIKIRERNIDE